MLAMAEVCCYWPVYDFLVAEALKIKLGGRPSLLHRQRTTLPFLLMRAVSNPLLCCLGLLACLLNGTPFLLVNWLVDSTAYNADLSAFAPAAVLLPGW